MGADFRDAMRGQFDAGQERFANDPFPSESGAGIVGRVKRRRVVTNAAVGGGTLAAVGAVAFAATHVAAPVQSPATGPSATGSPFECGVWLGAEEHRESALTFSRTDYLTVAEAEAEYGFGQRAVMVDPIVEVGGPLVPVVTVVSHDGTDASLAVGLDPAGQHADRRLGVTGVSLVKVRNGVVVAVADDGEPAPAATPAGDGAWGNVTNDGLTIYAFNDTFFETCPGVTSTKGAELYAVAGSQTWDRDQAGEAPIYVWKKMPPAR